MGNVAFPLARVGHPPIGSQQRGQSLLIVRFLKGLTHVRRAKGGRIGDNSMRLMYRRPVPPFAQALCNYLDRG